MRKEDCMKVTSFGIESARNTSVDASQEIYRVLLVYTWLGNQFLISKYCIDAGDGGARRDLMDKLNECGRVLKVN